MKNKWIIVLFLGFWLPSFAQEVLPTQKTENASSSLEQLTEASYTWGDFLIGKSCDDFLFQLQNDPLILQENLPKKWHTYCIILNGK